MSPAAAQPAKHPFEAPPVTNATPLKVVVLRDTTEPELTYKPKVIEEEEQVRATPRRSRVSSVRRRKSRNRTRQRRVDRSWWDQVLKSN